VPTAAPVVPPTSKILLVDDDPTLAAVLAAGLARRGVNAVRCAGLQEALARLHDPELEAVVTDLRMPQGSGTELCREVQRARPDLPVLVITAFGSLDTAIEVLRAGAYDLLPKPVDVDILVHAVRRATANRTLRLELAQLREVTTRPSYERMIGYSESMRVLFELIERVAASDVTTLVTGETGTGKELVARALHQRSARRDGPWQAINCAAIPESLLESELFGHVRGAFTDARSDRRGLLVRGHGGTVFLDEIGELPAHLQAKLLRAVQERRVRPVGSDDDVPFDARIIAATNRDLEQEVLAGRFRQDLLFRLSVVTIDIPPLRARATDVLALAQHFVEHTAAKHQRPVRGISPQAAARLLAYDWPGNVRELENCIERAVVLTRYTSLTIDDLPPRIREHAAALPTRLVDDSLVTLAELERRYVKHVLAAVGGNKSEAARILGVDRKTLARRLDP
jgi:two-component system response regulator AtoC